MQLCSTYYGFTYIYIFISLTLFEAKHSLETGLVLMKRLKTLSGGWSNYVPAGTTRFWCQSDSGIPVNTVHIPRTLFPSEHWNPSRARNAVPPEHLRIIIESPYTITSE